MLLTSRWSEGRSLKPTASLTFTWCGLNDRPRPDFVLCIAPGIRQDAASNTTVNTATKPASGAPPAQEPRTTRGCIELGFAEFDEPGLLPRNAYPRRHTD